MSKYLITTEKDLRPVRLIIFPHAGSSSLSYLKFSKSCPIEVGLSALDLPGRNRLVNEPWPLPWEKLIKNISEEINLDQRPTIFLGHSFGCLLALETAALFPGKKILGLSGLNSPTTFHNRIAIGPLSQDEFLERMKERGFILPDNLNPEIKSFLINLLKADLTMMDSYTLPPFRKIPTLVFMGDTDPLTSLEKIDKWSQITNLILPPQTLNGDHFFIFPHFLTITDQLLKNL